MRRGTPLGSSRVGAGDGLEQSAGQKQSRRSGGARHAKNGREELYVSAISVDPLRSSTVYASTEGAEVFEARTRGRSRTVANAGLTDLAVGALATVESPSGTSIYAGTEAGLFRAQSATSDWNAVCPAAKEEGDHGAGRRGGRVSVYAGTRSGKIFPASEAGSSCFDPVTGPWPGAVRALASLSGSARAIYAGTQIGVFKSADSGSTWSPSSTGLTNLVVLGLFAKPPSRLYAVTAGGIFRSENAGRTWTALPGETEAGPLAASLDSRTLYVGGRGAVARSTDGGRSWKSVALRRDAAN